MCRADDGDRVDQSKIIESMYEINIINVDTN